MQTPDEWADTVVRKIEARESQRVAEADSVDYQTYEAELLNLWEHTKAVFLRYVRAFCQHRDVLQITDERHLLRITRTDLSSDDHLVLILHHAQSLYNGIETRFRRENVKYLAYLTPEGIELVIEDSDTRTSPEEIAETALELLVTARKVR